MIAAVSLWLLYLYFQVSLNVKVKTMWNMRSITSSSGVGFIVMGDYGTGLPAQWQVGKQLEAFVSAPGLTPRPSFVISTGDQIYDHGLVDGNDAQLKSKFEDVYTSRALRIPWYISYVYLLSSRV